MGVRIAAIPIAGIAGMKNVTDNFCARDGCSVRVREFHAKDVVAFLRRVRFRGQFRVRLRSVRCIHGRCGARTGRRRNERAQRGLKLAFGIDQEIRGGDDLLAGFESFEHDEIVTGPRAQLHLARFEVTVAAIDKRNLPRARIAGRRLRE